MTRIMIQQLGPQTYRREPTVLTWSEYVHFSATVPGEGVTWKGVIL